MPYVTITSTSFIGFDLPAGGTVTNAASATIISSVGVEISGGPGVVINSGTIAGMARVVFTDVINSPPAEGVYLLAGGSVTNTTTGVILAGSDGVYIRGGVGTVVNYGTITGYNADGGNAGFGGIVLTGGGSVTNAVSGSITDYNNGILISGGAGTVVNAGSITGTNGPGVVLSDGGSVTNAASASITGSTNNGVSVFTTYGLVVNDGSITGGTDGVELSHGGFVTNAASASITGGGHGVYIQGGTGTVVNDGSIVGNTGEGVLLASGSVTNAASGSITGFTGVEINVDPGTVANAGSITGTSAYGVELTSGSVSNAASGSITGANQGIEINAGSGTVSNYGSIAGSTGDGVALVVGGYVTNAASASITGGLYGVGGGGAIGTILNSGSIAGISRAGVELSDGGSVSNAGLATITGGEYGIVIRGAGTVVNDGTIAGTANNGIALNAGGSVSNAASASISGGGLGVEIIGGAGTMVNDGTIGGGSRAGVALYTGGSVTNAALGSITGFYGVELLSGGTLITAGTITGTGGRAVVLSGDGSELVVDPGAVFNGTVGAGGSGNTLELASAATVGVIAGVGTSFTGFGTIALDAGAAWNASGNLLGETIAGLTGFDTLDLTGTMAASADYASRVLTLYDAGHTQLGTINLPGTFAATNDFVLTPDGNGGTNIGLTTLIDTTLTNGVTLTSPATTITSAGFVHNYAPAISGPSGTAWTVVNYGRIVSFQADGMDLASGGSVINAASGTINGYQALNIVGGTATVVNAGTIAGTAEYSNGVIIRNGGLLTNAASASIFGFRGVYFAASGTVVNAGTITGTGGTAVGFGVAGDRLAVDPGAVFNGAVSAAGTGNTLELGSGASVGTIAGIGTSFTGFDTIALDAGAVWNASGNLFGETIAGFSGFDSLDLTGTSAASAAYASGVLTLYDAGRGDDLRVRLWQYAGPDGCERRLAGGGMCWRCRTRPRSASPRMPLGPRPEGRWNAAVVWANAATATATASWRM